MLRLENVDKYFNRKKSNEIHVINNTSLEMGDTGLVALLGSSGCGKTTLLNAIGGLDRINSGNIYVNGKNISKGSSSKKDNIRNANIGYIFQNYNLIENSTVFDNVAIALRMIGVKDKAEIEKKVMYILEKVGIDRYRNRPARMLSGGERQRVGIARALVKNPRIVIADEPTGNLDSRNTIEIMNIIKAISRERLVILVTHEREIAQFYASRIIHIVDGCVVSDEINEHDGELDYRFDSRIYMQDLPDIQEMKGDGVTVRYFSDDSVNLDDIEIRIVIKNGNIYIDSPDSISDGFEGVELIDDHYRAMSKDIYEEYTLDEEEMIGKDFNVRYTSVFNPLSMITSGWKKITSYSIVKKILLLGFVMAAMIATYAVSSMVGILDIDDDEFVTQNQNYVTVKTGNLTPEKFDEIASMDGVRYAIPGDAKVSFNVPIDDYYQTYGQSTVLEGDIAKRSLLDEDSIVAGSMPEKDRDIVIDAMTAENMFDMETIKMIGIKSYDDLIGRKAEAAGKKFTICGVTEQKSPSIYVKNSYINDILFGRATDGEGEPSGEFEVIDKDVKVTKGAAPDSTYEILLPSDMESDTVKIGAELNQKVNGHKLKVSGFYIDKYGNGTKYVNEKTAKYAFIESKNQMELCTDDKETLMSILSQKNLNAIDDYDKDRKAYKESFKNQTIATLVAGAVVIIISLVEMYLMLRSSFLSRIKEVGVLRAIGLKKKDVYKMFSGEVLVLTALTAIPGIGVMAYIMKGVADAPSIGEQYYMSLGLAIALIVLFFIFNLIAGLLPVFRTMRKTPAQILARNDAD